MKEINYKNKDKEVITINSLNEQTAGQAEVPEQGTERPDYKKAQLNCYYLECPCYK